MSIFFDKLHTTDFVQASDAHSNEKRDKARLIIVGLGLHAIKAHIPSIQELAANKGDIDIVAVIDVEKNAEIVKSRMIIHGLKVPLLLIDPISHLFSAKDAIKIDRLFRKTRANGVIIATPPEFHFAWAMNVIKRGVSVFIDKPVTSRVFAVNEISQAEGIRQDIEILIDEYKKVVANGMRVAVMVGCQRRYDTLLNEAVKKVIEVTEKTGCPVTSISVSHGDGQFRLPHELIDISYHGYENGMGKISHSTYHFLDFIWRLCRISWREHSRPDQVRVLSSIVQPGSLLRQIPRETYSALFGEEFEKLCGYSFQEINRISRQMGEMDATLLLEFCKEGEIVTQITLGMHHNSVSSRCWLHPREDLYKAMGRLKHESWSIQSGPFQTLTLETRQCEDKQEEVGYKGHNIGDPNHRQIRIFRNAGLIGGSRYQSIAAHELPGYDPERLVCNQAKVAMLSEFFDFIQNHIERDELQSDLCDHLIPASLMSAAYVSHIRRRSGRDGFVEISLDWEKMT